MEGHDLIEYCQYIVSSYSELEDFPCNDLQFQFQNCCLFNFEKFIEKQKFPIKKIDLLIIFKAENMERRIILLEYKTLPVKTIDNKNFLTDLDDETLDEAIKAYIEHWKVHEKFKQSIEKIQEVFRIKNPYIEIFIFENIIRYKDLFKDISMLDMFHMLANSKYYKDEVSYAYFNLRDKLNFIYEKFKKVFESFLKQQDIIITDCRGFKEFMETFQIIFRS